MVQPVAGGGLSPSIAPLQLKMTFKEGGAFDFHSNFERIKECLHQAVENARGAGRNGTLHAVNFSTVHLDELPAYEGPSTAPVAANVGTLFQDQVVESSSGRGRNSTSSPDRTARGEQFEAPSEPPPGYEEVQQESVVNALEDRLRRSP
jgi:hypothetical protein